MNSSSNSEYSSKQVDEDTVVQENIDKQRRFAIKALGLGVVAPASLGTVTAMASTIDSISADASADSAMLPAHKRLHDLELHVFSSNQVVEDSLIVLEPHQTRSFQVVAEPLYGKQWSQQSNLLANDYVEYLWAEDSVSQVGENAVLVSAAAFVSDNRALLYSKPGQSVGVDVVQA